MKTISVKTMSEIDKRTIEEHGTPGSVLMERAGAGAAREILEYAGHIAPHCRRIVMAAGKGNNGGDAYAAAKFLKEHSDIEILIYSICPPDELTGDARYHFKMTQGDVRIIHKQSISTADFRKGDVIVDALLGTGFKGELRPPYDSWIEAINGSGCPVVAMDIPSGLNGDSGIAGMKTIVADLTVTMALPKTGLLVNDGPAHCGRIRIIDIGIPPEYIQNLDSRISFFNCDEAYRMIKRLPFGIHKNRRGTVLVIGGSSDYQGAPFLAGKAALRTGAGLVTVAVPESARISNPSALSIITRRIKDGGCGMFDEKSVELLRTLAEQHDSVVIGPGMTNNSKAAPVLGAILKLGKCTVIDADGLNLLSENPGLLIRNEKFVLTPHPGEASRLFTGFGIRPDDRIEQAESLAALSGGTVVLKGCRSIVACNGEYPSVNGSGSPALATAGSGDVLSGMIAAFLAAGMSGFNATRLAVFIHGLTAETWTMATRGMIADDIADLIPQTLKTISPFA